MKHLAILQLMIEALEDITSLFHLHLQLPPRIERSDFFHQRNNEKHGIQPCSLVSWSHASWAYLLSCFFDWDGSAIRCHPTDFDGQVGYCHHNPHLCLPPEAKWLWCSSHMETSLKPKVINHCKANNDGWLPINFYNQRHFLYLMSGKPSETMVKIDLRRDGNHSTHFGYQPWLMAKTLLVQVCLGVRSSKFFILFPASSAQNFPNQNAGVFFKIMGGTFKNHRDISPWARKKKHGNQRRSTKWLRQPPCIKIHSLIP